MKLCVACLNTNHETDLLLSVENAEFLKNAVAEVSREEGTGINQFVIVAIAEKLAALRTGRFFAERRALADVDAAQRILFRDGGQPPDPEDRLPQVGESERVSSGRQEGRPLLNCVTNIAFPRACSTGLTESGLQSDVPGAATRHVIKA